MHECMKTKKERGREGERERQEWREGGKKGAERKGREGKGGELYSMIELLKYCLCGD